MRTKTSIPFNFQKKTLAYTTEEVLPVNIDEVLRLYIPLIMSGITKGSPMEWTVKSKGKGVFVNAVKCRPNAAQTLTAKNYINVKKQDNTSMTRIEIDKGGIAKIPKDKKLECTFTHGKLKNCTFNSNTFTEQG